MNATPPLDPLLEIHAQPVAPIVAPVPPRWIRVPASGEKCEWSGLTHSGVYGLLKRAGRSIRSARIAVPGAKRGTRLIWLPDLLSYLHALADKQAASDPATASPSPAS